jgi:MoaA/NifB/PqqE/SkfB family radical SAM enzyme
VFFGGYGEPLAHPDIVQMVMEARALGGPVELITNGTLLDDEMASGLVAAGLDRLWVSLDGARPESYADVRLGAALPEVLANIMRFRRRCPSSRNRRPELGIAFVAMKRNIADLPALLQLAGKLGAARVLVTNLLPHTAELRDEILYAHALKDVAYLESPQVPQISLPRIDIDEITASGLYAALRSQRNVTFAGNNLGSAVGRCPFIDADAAAVGWNGNLSPCLPLLHDHASYLGRRLRRVHHYAVGNVADQSLDALWLHPEHQAFRERVRRFVFSPCAYCGGCERSLANLEDCFGHTFPTCGGCLWAQGVIRCP